MEQKHVENEDILHPVHAKNKTKPNLIQVKKNVMFKQSHIQNILNDTKLTDCSFRGDGVDFNIVNCNDKFFCIFKS